MAGSISAAALFNKAKGAKDAPKISEADRAKQKKAAQEALDTARANLKKGSSVNPPESAAALEQTMAEIAGAEEEEEEKPTRGKKKAAKRAGKATVAEEPEDADADAEVDVDVLAAAELLRTINAFRRAAADCGYDNAHVVLL